MASRGRFQAEGAIATLRRFRADIEAYDEHTAEALNTTLEIESTRITTHMKTTAHWTDRTGNARSGLYCEVSAHVDPGGGRQWAALELGYTVPYGKWLEIANNQRYAIIIPTLRGPMPRRIYRTLRRQMG